jgi:hypothetical protein
MTEVPFAPPLAERVKLLLSRTEYRPPSTLPEREEIYRLRYDAYLHEGAIQPNSTAKLHDKFDNTANCHVIGVYIDGSLAASVRVHVVCTAHASSPALETFGSELEHYLKAGHTIIDPNRFVAAHALSRLFPELPYIALRIAFIAAGYFDATIVTATVRKEHAAFYRRVLRCTAVTTPRPYPTLIKPLGLMTVDYRVEAPAVLARYPFFAAQTGEATRMFDPVQE